MKPIIAITPDYNYELQKYILSQQYIDAVKKLEVILLLFLIQMIFVIV